MPAQVEGMAQEMLRRIHSKLDDIQGEMRLRYTGVETGLAAIDRHLSAFHAVDAARTEDISGLRRRIERVERRLDLREATEHRRRRIARQQPRLFGPGPFEGA